MYGYDIKPKLQRKHPEEPKPIKAHQVRSNVKFMLTVFFNCNSVVYHVFLSQGRTVNKEYYLEVMTRLLEAIRQKRTELWKNQSRILQHDNVLLLCKFLVKNKTYSPDFSPVDVFLFPKLKTPMKGKRFTTIEEIENFLIIMAMLYHTMIFIVAMLATKLFRADGNAGNHLVPRSK